MRPNYLKFMPYADLRRHVDDCAFAFREALSQYTLTPCSHTVKKYQSARDMLEQATSELQDRESEALNRLPIEAALKIFGVPFEIINGQAKIL